MFATNNLLRIVLKNRLLFRRSLATSLVSPLIKPTKIINYDENLTLNITKVAAEKLDNIYNESRQYLNINIENGGCHGYQYNLNLVDDTDKNNLQERKVNEADEFSNIGETNRMITYLLKHGKVEIDSHSLKIINNSTLNFTTELIGSFFKIESDSLKNSCGCGTSFDIEK